jgi:hypothetical protein
VPRALGIQQLPFLAGHEDRIKEAYISLTTFKPFQTTQPHHNDPSLQTYFKLNHNWLDQAIVLAQPHHFHPEAGWLDFEYASNNTL